MKRGNKQLRLVDIPQIKSNSKDLLGKKINVVLRNGMVILGELIKINDAGLIVKNMRLKKIHYPFENISEVYLDIFV